jgi:hypothetical protein
MLCLQIADQVGLLHDSASHKTPTCTIVPERGVRLRSTNEPIGAGLSAFHFWRQWCKEFSPVNADFQKLEARSAQATLRCWPGSSRCCGTPPWASPWPCMNLNTTSTSIFLVQTALSWHTEAFIPGSSQCACVPDTAR